MTQFYISYFSEFATVLWYTFVKVIRDLLISSIFKCMRLTTHFARSVTSVESPLIYMLKQIQLFTYGYLHVYINLVFALYGIFPQLSANRVWDRLALSIFYPLQR